MANWLNIVLTWLPAVFFGTVFLLAVFLYVKRQNKKFVVGCKSLVVSSIIFRFFYAFLLTVGQYYIWSRNNFTKPLVNSSYFLFYSYGRFWLNSLISIGAAFLFYLFLNALKKYKERFFEEGEIKLGFLAALIAGWPNFIVFVPLVFIFVALISVFKGLFLKEVYTTLGWPFILAILAILVFGGKLAVIFKLGVLKI